MFDPPFYNLRKRETAIQSRALWRGMYLLQAHMVITCFRQKPNYFSTTSLGYDIASMDTWYVAMEAAQSLIESCTKILQTLGKIHINLKPISAKSVTLILAAASDKYNDLQTFRNHHTGDGILGVENERERALTTGII